MRKVNWAVLGTADVANRETIPGILKSEHANLYAIAGRSSEKIEDFKNRFTFKKSYIDYDELLDDKNVEAVYLPLTHDLHKEWLIKAARKKKHVLCEKPLVGTAADVLEVMAVFKEEGVLFMEAFAFFHSPLFRDLFKRIEEGVIGKVKFIETMFYIPTYFLDDEKRTNKAQLGGAQYYLGCYNIAFILRVLGEMPTQVNAMAQLLETGVDKYCHTVMKFPNGTTATSSTGMVLDEVETYRIDRCLLEGEEGRIEVLVQYNGSGEQSYNITRGVNTEVVQIKVPDNFALEIDQFSKCIRGIEEPLVSNELSYQIAAVQDQIFEKIGY